MRAWINDMEQAAEEKDRGAMLDRISESYADARGNSQEDIGDMLRIYMLRQQNVSILSTIDDITISGETAANVSLTVAMAGTSSGTLGLSADAYHFELELEKPDNDWLLIGARWGELGQEPR